MAALIRASRENLFKHMNIVCLALVVLGFWLLNPNFLSAFNIRNILTDTAPLLLVASALTFVLILGCIDLSTGSVISCSCVIAGLYIGQTSSLAMIGLMIVLGLAAGLLNGLIYTMLRVPTFVATLCTSAIWSCAALLISGGAPKGIPIKQWKSIAWSKFTPLGIPIMFLIAVAVLLALYFIQCRAKVGKPSLQSELMKKPPA